MSKNNYLDGGSMLEWKNMTMSSGSSQVFALCPQTVGKVSSPLQKATSLAPTDTDLSYPHPLNFILHT